MIDYEKNKALLIEHLQMMLNYVKEDKVGVATFTSHHEAETHETGVNEGYVTVEATGVQHFDMKVELHVKRG